MVDPLSRAGRAPLVGREDELTVLGRALAEARGGRLLAVMLAGEPGIGKTRLLDEFPAPAQAAGAVVVRGGASQAEGMPPYLPFLEALDECVAAAALDDLRQDLGRGAAVLAPLLPAIAERLPGPLPLPPIAPEHERLRLHEAVAAFLAAIAARAGVLVLALDDLHWADAATCDLLVHVARRLRRSPVLLLGAYREGEAEDSAALVLALAELARLRVLRRLALAPLAPGESTALASRLLGGAVAPEVGALLHRHAEGNPYFEEELLRALVETGALVRRGARSEVVAEPERLLPEEVAGAVRMRLDRLAADAREALTAAALLGRAFAPEPLAAVLGTDAAGAEDRLLPAVRARLLRPGADGGYAFTHDKVRETLLSGLAPARRRRLHAAIGRALEAAEPPRPPTDLAHHFLQAGDRGRGAPYALRAGDQALAAHAPAEAAGHYRTAAGLLDGPARADALLRLSRASALAGDHPAALESARQAASAHLRLGDRAGAAHAWLLIGAARWRAEVLGEARQAFERALELLPQAGGASAAEIMLQLADLHASGLSRPAEGLAHAERALAIVRPLGDRRLEAAACRTAGDVRARAGDLDGGRALLERGLLLARERDDPAQAAEACASLAQVAYWSGDIADAWRLQSEREELARRTQDPYELRHVYSWLATLRACRGEWDAADRLFEREEAIVGQLESPEPLAFLRAMRAGQLHRRGRFAEAEAGYRQAIGVLRRAGSGTVVWYLAGHGQALFDLGRIDEARDRAEETERSIEALDEGSLARGFALAGLALLYARLGDAAGATSCYPRMRAHPGRFHGVLFDRALGVAAAAAGDVDAARAALARAESLGRREGLWPELAVALLQRGPIQRAAEPAAARAAIDEGRRLAAALGMGELARRLLDGPAPGRLERASDELTPRERELLRQLARGRTNRQIAAALSVSEKTVANALTTVFAKLGVENRAAAVAHALRHGPG